MSPAIAALAFCIAETQAIAERPFLVPGIIGSLQANETLKLALGIGNPLIGRLMLFDALTATFDEVALRRDPNCPVCGDAPTITEYIDYVEFCAGPTHA